MVVWHAICIVLWIIWSLLEALTNDLDIYLKPKAWTLSTTIYMVFTSLMGLYLIVKFGFIQNEWLFAEIK